MTGTTTQPQRNRKFCQFKKDQYCNLPELDRNRLVTGSYANLIICINICSPIRGGELYIFSAKLFFILLYEKRLFLQLTSDKGI